MNSMKQMHSVLTMGICERRPSARTMPIGNEATMPVTPITTVSIRPPNLEVSTGSRPRPPVRRKNAMTG
jgi:hypothetical protein